MQPRTYLDFKAMKKTVLNVLMTHQTHLTYKFQQFQNLTRSSKWHSDTNQIITDVYYSNNLNSTNQSVPTKNDNYTQSKNVTDAIKRCENVFCNNELRWNFWIFLDSYDEDWEWMLRLRILKWRNLNGFCDYLKD